jgi:hypothetical protein
LVGANVSPCFFLKTQPMGKTNTSPHFSLDKLFRNPASDFDGNENGLCCVHQRQEFSAQNDLMSLAPMRSVPT